MIKLLAIWIICNLPLTVANPRSPTDTLPDVGNIMAGLTPESTPGDFRRLAEHLGRLNTSLQSPELHLYATLMHARAGDEAAAGKALAQAIAAGMQNPDVLDLDPQLVLLRKSPNYPALRQSLDSIRRRVSNPDRFTVDTRALDRLTGIMDTPGYRAADRSELLSKFVVAGSPGLRDFYLNSYKRTGDMDRIFRQRDTTYRTLAHLYRNGTYDDLAHRVREGIDRFAAAYEGGTFPTVYLLPGVFRSGGTASNTGLLIGAETFIGDLPAGRVPTAGYTDSLLDGMSHTIVHELMHFQQRYAGADPGTVLYKVIEEGAATFLTTLFMEGDTTRINSPFLRKRGNLDRVLARFRTELYGTDTGEWVYNEGSPDWPRDIGYELGAELCRSFYLRAGDKQAALRTLLTSESLTDIIAGSDYSHVLR